MSTKRCVKCKISKNLSDFTNNKTKKDGKNNYCKICQQIYRKQNKKHIQKYLKTYRAKNKNQLSDWYKKYRHNNKKRIKDKDAQYRKKNKDKIQKYNKKWRQKNRDLINNKKKQYYCRRKLNIDYRLLNNLRSRIRAAIKNGKKCMKTTEILGASIESVRLHLESKFTEGMNWANYGLYGWHIDHIVPCDKFDLSKKSEQKKCFHYTNLQPLWAKENIKKSNKIIY